ncbi:MAG: hypothetical protein NVS9B13_12950 [Candidatus Acidiferrum sp.]
MLPGSFRCGPQKQRPSGRDDRKKKIRGAGGVGKGCGAAIEKEGCYLDWSRTSRSAKSRESW